MNCKSIIIILIALSWLTLSAKEKRYTHNTQYSKKDIPFFVKINQQQYQGVLNKLKNCQLQINKENVLESIKEELKFSNLPPSQDYDKVANEIFNTYIDYKINRRLKQFNNSLNLPQTTHTFTHLAKSMARSNQREQNTTIGINAIYSYNPPSFSKEGKWQFNDGVYTSGTTSRSLSSTGEIDEKFQISLKKYGSKESISIHFKAQSEVKISESYEVKKLSGLTLIGKPQLTVNILPYTIVKCHKTIEGNSLLSATGKNFGNTALQKFKAKKPLTFELVAQEYRP